MNEAKHTPGPLMIRDFDGTMVPHCDACVCVKCTDGTYLTKLCPLHAAAPAMKEALDKTIDHIDEMPADAWQIVLRTAPWIGAMDRAFRAALRKATLGALALVLLAGGAA